MALLGGGVGGAGNPVGGSFTGPAEALEIIADHAYAYSGLKQIDTSEVEHLNFTTGNYLFVGTMHFQGCTDPTDPATGKSSVFTVQMNDVAIAGVKVDSAVEGMPSVMDIDLIIPPYTEIEVTCRSPATTSGLDTSVLLSGRIYRTRD